MNPHHNGKDSIAKRLVRRHGTAVAYVALFAALGGSAYAAVTITGANIKDGTVTGKDVKNARSHPEAERHGRQLAGGPARPPPAHKAQHGAVVSSAPAGADGTGWAVTYSNEFSRGTMTAYAWVFCAKVRS